MKLAFANHAGTIRRSTTMEELQKDQEGRHMRTIAKPTNERQAEIYRDHINTETRKSMAEIRQALASEGSAFISNVTRVVAT